MFALWKRLLRGRNHGEFIVRKGRRIAFAAIVAFHNRGLRTDQSCFHKTRNLGAMLLQTHLESAEIGFGENVGEVGNKEVLVD